MDVLHLIFKSSSYDLAIIPTVLIPLTALSVVLTSIAGIIASWFGIKLKTEGPKQLLEVLLKKRVLISAIILNIVFYGGYKGYIYFKNLPRFISTINKESNKNAIPSTQQYENSVGRIHQYTTEFKKSKDVKLVSLFQVKLPKGAFRSGVISGSSIFYGADDGKIYEIDQNLGRTIRTFYIGTQVTTRPIIFNGHLYSGEGNHDTHHARIYSFDLKSGQFEKAFNTKGHTEGQPWIHLYKNESTLFLTAGLDGLFAIDPITMKEKWHFNEGHLDATINAEEGIIYIGTGFEKGASDNKSHAFALDFKTGKKIFKTELPVSNWMHPVILSKYLCFALGEIYFPSETGFLYCLDKKTGKAEISIPFNAPVASKPLLLTDKKTGREIVIVSDFKGTICSIDIEKKEKLWCYETGNTRTDYALSSAEFDPNTFTIWYPSLDNGLFAFDPVTGKLLLHWKPSANDPKWRMTFASATIHKDQLYIVDLYGNLRKFKITF